jgi:hypothetical protein
MAQRVLKGNGGLMKVKRLMAFANPDHQGAVGAYALGCTPAVFEKKLDAHQTHARGALLKQCSEPRETHHEN